MIETTDPKRGKSVEFLTFFSDNVSKFNRELNKGYTSVRNGLNYYKLCGEKYDEMYEGEVRERDTDHQVSVNQVKIEFNKDIS